MNNTDEILRKAHLTMAHTEYNRDLNVHAYFKTHNKFLSEDLVQETFLKTWNYLVKGGEIVLMKAFLYHVLNNLIIDEYRRKKHLSLDELLEKGYEPADVSRGSLIEMAGEKMEGEKAFGLIKLLPKTYEKVMKMRHIEDLTISEIAKITNKTKNSIAVQLHRGLAKLKALYINR
jgi:RNA polymerase sigma-70 factor, ECF subfamily